MHIAKRLARGLASAAFKFCILLAAITAATAMTFGTPDKLKGGLAESKLYDSVVDGALEQIKKGNDPQAPPEGQPAPEGELEQHIPLDDAAIEKIAHQAFPTSLLQSSFEQIIDGTYRWLNGEVQQPDFKVDLSPVKTNLANAIGDEAVRRVQALPVCTPEQLRGLNMNEVKAFELPCVPPGLNLQAERQKIVDEVLSSKDFLKEPVITADNLKNNKGKTPFQTLSNAPKLFQWGGRLPWIAGGVALVTAAALLWLHDDRRRGLFVIARALLVSGIMLLAGTLLASFVFDRIRPPGELAESASLQTALLALIRDLSSTFNKVLMVFAGTYTILGAGGLIALHFTKPTVPRESSTTDAKSPEPKDKLELPKEPKKSA